MKRLLPVLLTAIIFMMANTSEATVVVITQQNNTFSPNSTTVQVGDTVRWVWTSGVHTTTSAIIPEGAEAWDSPLTESVQQFDYVVTVEGTYNYVCTPHIDLGMIGSFQATETLGVQDNLFTSNISLYPNPAKDQTALKLTSEKAGYGSLSVYDLLGNRINMTEVSVKQGQNNIPVPIENLNPGIYFIEIKYNNQSAIVRRFVKSR